MTPSEPRNAPTLPSAPAALAGERILVVDDEPDVRDVLTLGLSRMGFSVVGAADASEAVAQLADSPFALMLTDLRMPRVSGIQLLHFVRAEYPDMAVIIVTATDERETAVEAMRAGAYDFIVKPFNFAEIHFSVERALEKRQLSLEVRAQQAALEQKVAERTQALQAKNEELQGLIVGVIETIAVMLEVRDEYTAHHSHRVAALSGRLAEQLGLDVSHVERIRLAALLHDIGKIGIRESVLHKEGRLTPEEFQHIKTHPLIAEQILRPLTSLEPIILPIKHEHEAFDGSGYPDGLARDAIPLEARIIAVADAYDALTSDRPYRRALSHADALAILRADAGRVWDPALVQLFEAMMAEGEELGGM